jgi:hypothetical protein
LDGDGDLDLATTQRDTEQIYVLTGDGTGAFTTDPV